MLMSLKDWKEEPHMLIMQALVRRMAAITKDEVPTLTSWQSREICKQVRRLRGLGERYSTAAEGNTAAKNVVEALFSAASSPDGVKLRKQLVLCSKDLRPFLTSDQHALLSKFARYVVSDLESTEGKTLSLHNGTAQQKWEVLASACATFQSTDVNAATAAATSTVEMLAHVKITAENMTPIRIALLHLLSGLATVRIDASLALALQEKCIEFVEFVLSVLGVDGTDFTVRSLSTQTASYSLHIATQAAAQIPATCDDAAVHERGAVWLTLLPRLIEALCARLPEEPLLECVATTLRKIDASLRFIHLKRTPQVVVERAIIAGSLVLRMTTKSLETIPVDFRDVFHGGLLRMISKMDETSNEYEWSSIALDAKVDVTKKLVDLVFLPLRRDSSNVAHEDDGLLETMENPQDLITCASLHGNDEQFSRCVRLLSSPTCAWTQNLFDVSSNGKRSTSSVATWGATQVDRWRTLFIKCRRARTNMQGTGIAHDRADAIQRAMIRSLFGSLHQSIERCSPDFDHNNTPTSARSLQRTGKGLDIAAVEAFLTFVAHGAVPDSSCETSPFRDIFFRVPLVQALLRATAPNSNIGLLLVKLVSVSWDKNSDLRRDLLSVISRETPKGFYSSRSSSDSRGTTPIVSLPVVIESLASVCVTIGFEPSMVEMFEGPINNALVKFRNQRNARSPNIILSRHDIVQVLFKAAEAYVILAKHFRTKHARTMGELLCSTVELLISQFLANPAQYLVTAEGSRTLATRLFRFGIAITTSPLPRLSQARLHDVIIASLHIAFQRGETLCTKDEMMAHDRDQAVTWSSMMVHGARKAQFLIDLGKQPDRVRGAGTHTTSVGTISDGAKAIRFLMMYQMVVNAAISASRRHDLSCSASIIGKLSLHEALCVAQVDATLHILLEHQRTIRLLSSTNMLAKKPLMRSLTSDVLEAYITGLEKLSRDKNSNESSDDGKSSRGQNRGLSVLEHSAFVTDSALISFELSSHAGFTTEQRSRLLSLLLELVQRDETRGKQRARLSEIVARGEVLFV
ncbi:Hypothetical protein, putative [Bodo saltans]|nr:Hypothetical protein, putative [Bodo saltans]|eukprot:CUG86378.1 Hypothetical protein, putative [Bodo saltans]